ncbi:unnamed protein product [Plutella xylostella]|uniref:(diamondback moth) hypothetical protein n=1 Tax=Plutella xylostella TaxID=51655 RepID=A0A8S4G0C7_PLUXY|nr:unnamed protein product [Plutella xylostella]
MSFQWGFREFEKRLSRKNGVKDEEQSWYWDPPPAAPSDERYKQQIQELQKEISSMKENNQHGDCDEEFKRLKEENKQLTASLEDLDHQHQQAMERLLSLKKELQKNFEVLKQEHEDLKSSNDEYADQIKVFERKMTEKDGEIAMLAPFKADYETLSHKYQNLERVYGVLKENAEKFQEENQDLHEEVFKLQEQVTKMEHEMEITNKNAELSNMVPRDKYEELEKEIADLKSRRSSDRVDFDEVNIDDNAKSVIENLKRDINALKHQLQQKVQDSSDLNLIKSEKLSELYNKYVNFDLPEDYVGTMPSDDNEALAKVENALKTLSIMKRNIDTLKHDLSEKSLSINHLQTQIDDLTTENEFLTTDMQHFEREASEMKKNNDFLISEITALKNSSKLEPIIETHEDNLVKLETELAHCSQINKSFESEIARVENELTAVKEEKVQLQKSLDELKEKYKIMINELEDFKNQTKTLEEIETKLENKGKYRSQEIDDLKKRLVESESRAEKLAIDLQIAENDKVILDRQKDELKEQIQKCMAPEREEQLSSLILHTKVQDLNNQIADLTKTKMELETVIKAYEEKNNTVNDTEKKNSAMEMLKLENTTLKHEIEKISSNFSNLKLKEQELISTNANLQTHNQQFERTVNELKTELSAMDILKAEIKDLTETKQKLEKELVETDEKIAKLTDDFDKLESTLGEKDNIIDTLNNTINKNNLTFNQHAEDMENLQMSLAIKNQEIEGLQTKIQNLSKITQLNDELTDKVKTLQNELTASNVTIAELKTKMEDITASYVEHKELLNNKNQEIKEMNQSIAQQEDKEAIHGKLTDDNYTILYAEKETMTKEITHLKEKLETKEKELEELKSNHTALEHAYEECQTTLNQSAQEKAELINLITMKHNESLQYHNEIQRLNQAILSQNTEFQNRMKEKDELISANVKCEQCDNLRTTLKEKDEIIVRLNQNNSADAMKAELDEATSTVSVLKEKCDNLESNLANQTEKVKQLMAENAKLSELEANSTKELERLRQHLMETEENYTQELMSSEQKLQECMGRLNRVEERAKQNSTVYTSNSIRANQEVETLRTQIKLLERKAEDIGAKLSASEDAKAKSEASLTSLLLVLDQFQQDKERDIEAATIKLHNKIENLKKQNGELSLEINSLKAKLEESISGLQAASRLGDQLETKTAQIQELKEQVRTLQTTVAAAEERYQRTITNQQDKVDRKLVKNMLLNYVQSQGQSASNRTQVLRVLSGILDLNQEECSRLGLARPSEGIAAEFVRFLEKESRPTNRFPTVQEMTAERAARPQPSPEPQPTHKRNLSTGSNNLLFQNIDALETASQYSAETSSVHSDSKPVAIVAPSLETGVNQTRNNEGAILKQVLNNSM